MEAKGCAKPTVWKNARRHFYWALRARVAQLSALKELEDASPDSTPEQRLNILNSLASLDSSASHRQIAETLEKVDVSQSAAQLKADHLLRQLIELTNEDRKTALESFSRLADTLSDEEKSALVSVLKSG